MNPQRSQGVVYGAIPSHAPRPAALHLAAGAIELRIFYISRDGRSNAEGIVKHHRAKTRAQFCTRCGNELEEFCVSPEAKNLEALHAAALRCKLEGRKNGKVCAKIFIAGDTPSSTLLAGPRKRITRKSLQDLKESILRTIREQADR